MNEITSTPKNLKILLQNNKYTIHYYQREYRWQAKHINELIEDLTSEFLNNYKPDHKRSEVENYGTYFMGSIVIAKQNNAIIDGQQRFSSLTLLLMYLNNRLRQKGEGYDVLKPLIFSEKYGEKSFTINVPERQICMETIFKGDEFSATNAEESVKNLWERYKDIRENFPESITDEMILYFCDWLIEKVIFVEIVADTDQDAQKVFVTMNDRGLNLTSTEMLKGYLLSEITDDNTRESINFRWKETISDLKKDDDKGDEIFIKAWLRAQYAADEEDSDMIGGAFHQWIRKEHERLKLKISSDYENFIEDFFRFTKIYCQIKNAEKNFDETTKYIYYNSQLMFTLQPQLLMASICEDDTADIITKKINLTARFIDLLINSRVTQYRSVAQNIVKHYVFDVTLDIRRVSVDELKNKLKDHYEKLNYNYLVLQSFGLNSFTKKYIKNILSRITGFIEEQTNVNSNYVEYMKPQGKNTFQIEHIICSDFEKFQSVFSGKEEFEIYRNSIGALLLFRGSINKSLSDKKYKIKRAKYGSNDGNIFTASLVESTYDNNPQFKKFIEENNLPFKPYSKFGKAEIKERINLVIQLAKLIWNTKEFEFDE